MLLLFLSVLSTLKEYTTIGLVISTGRVTVPTVPVPCHSTWTNANASASNCVSFFAVLLGYHLIVTDGMRSCRYMPTGKREQKGCLHSCLCCSGCAAGGGGHLDQKWTAEVQ